MHCWYVFRARRRAMYFLLCWIFLPNEDIPGTMRCWHLFSIRRNNLFHMRRWNIFRRWRSTMYHMLSRHVIRSWRDILYPMRCGRVFGRGLSIVYRVCCWILLPYCDSTTTMSRRQKLGCSRRIMCLLRSWNIVFGWRLVMYNLCGRHIFFDHRCYILYHMC